MDLDGDGNIDILSGSYSRMDGAMAGLFQVLRGNEDGTFRKAEAVRGTDGEPLIVPHDPETALLDAICTRPTAADLDGDGHLDLVVGNFAGTFCWFRGGGSGKFAPMPEWLLAPDGERVHVEHHSDPFVVDWDADGDLDIVSGSSAGSVSLITNVGTAKSPKFAKPVTLVKIETPPFDQIVFGEEHVKAPNMATRVAVADVNGDGKLDLLVGDSVRLKYPAEGLTEEEARGQMELWQKDFAELQGAAPEIADFENMTDEEEAAWEAHSERQSELWTLRAEIVREVSTGYVWLYERK
ncbi:MAG: FG-GAP and VCBS repeat-containing protein [Planctomycetota bacterium]